MVTGENAAVEKTREPAAAAGTKVLNVEDLKSMTETLAAPGTYMQSETTVGCRQSPA